MSIVTVNDSHVSWIKQSFMLPKDGITAVDKAYRELTTADFKFTDTRLGGNFCINNIPQYTHYCDLPRKGRYSGNQSATFHKPKGMGRYYSEAIDDNAQYVHLRFGVPAYNGMVSFFTGFFNNDAAQLAKNASGTTLSYTAGRITGFIASLYAWPILLAGTLLKILFLGPSSKYYYFKPAMITYWNRVNTVVNSLAVNMGLVSRIWTFDDTVNPGGEDIYRQNRNITSAEKVLFQKEAPDIFHSSGAIDIYAVANRSQRLANDSLKHIRTIGENENLTSQQISDQINAYVASTVSEPNDKRSLEDYSKQYHETFLGQKVDSSKDASKLGAGFLPTWAKTNPASPEPDDTKEGAWQTISSFAAGLLEGVVENARADLQDGAQFVTFKVDYTGTAEESFSNSVTESSIAGTLNGMSSNAASIRFATMDGNTGIAPIDGLTGMAKDFLGGALESFHVSGLMSLAGSAFVDIPKVWENSSATFTRNNYTMELRSPYGNTMARFQNLYIPLAMLLAGALPLSTGKQSYTSPYLVQMFNKGRSSVRLGIIDSLSVTRGTGNMGWTRDGYPLGIDISFSVIDLSSVLHMPVAPSYSLLNPIDGIFDNETAWTDYLATLSSLTVAEQYYESRKIVRNLTIKWTQFRSNFSTAKISNSLFNGQFGQFINAFMRTGERTLGN